MCTFNIHAAETQLSRLAGEAAKGEAFVIAQADKPLVEAVPVDGLKTKRRIGLVEGESALPDDFDADCARLAGTADCICRKAQT